MIVNDMVSVIIPAYNAEKYIKECIGSVLSQTYKHFEIIAINDGSTDKTLEVLNSIKDNRLKVINQQNKGCSAAKNIGLTYAKGDFIQYLDADDLLSDDKLEIQLNALQNKTNTIAVCKTVVFQSIDFLDTGVEICTNLLQLTEDSFEFLLNLLGKTGIVGMVQPNAYLTPRTVIDKVGLWDEEISPSPDEDGEYFTRVLLASEKIIFTDGVNYYRKIPGNNSLSQKKSFQYAIGAFNTIKKKFENIFQHKFSPEILKLYTNQLTVCSYQFGLDYPEIIEFSKEEFKKNGIKKFELIEHNYFYFFNKIIGFSMAMRFRVIKYFLNNVLNKY